MMASPQVMETISTGKFTMSFKSMVPIFENDEFIGMVEVITHFNPIIKELQQAGIDSVVLVDKRYREQLSKAISQTFIEDYYVANFDVLPKRNEEISEIGIKQLLSSNHLTHNENLLTTHRIPDIFGNDMGYFIQFVPLTTVNNSDLNTLIRNIIIAALTVIFVILAIATLLYRNKQLIEREKYFLQSVTNSSSDLMLIIKQGNITNTNKAFQHLFPDMTGQHIEQLIPFINDTRFLEKVHAAQCWQQLLSEQQNKEQDLRLSIQDKDYYFSLNIQPLTDQREHYVLRLMDITERKISEDKLRLSSSVFTHAREGIMITQSDGRIIDINDAFQNITGYAREDVLGKTPNILNSGHHGSDFFTVLWHDISEKGYWSGELWNRKKSGENYAQMLTVSAVDDPDGTRYYVALFSDITAQKKQQQQLEQIAHFDPLTGLPNRRHITNLLHQVMANAETNQNTVAVFYLDLDGFKAVNDNHSHDFGDKLLQTLANRMTEALGPNDIIGRVGGDEFIGALVNRAPDISCEPIFNHLLKQLEKSVYVNGYKLQISASIGVTYYPQSSPIDADKLVRQADQAMYQAKLSGKNRFHIFDAEKDLLLRGRHEAIENIRLAFERGEFELFYQPKVNMATGDVVGAEALIRWRHPEQGILLPSHFIPTISTHPLSVDMGEWVIETALQQIAEWQNSGLEIPVSVNISPLQLQDPEFSHRLKSILEQNPEVSPSTLRLEVIETHALENLSEALNAITESKAMGVSFALDDFGTGYSSLSYLKQLPVEELKIDRSFVQGMLLDPEDLAILEATLGLANTFQHHIIAEGVETEEQGLRLLQLGCEEAQGFFISKAIPANHLPRWISEWKAPESWLMQKPLKTRDLIILNSSTNHRVWSESINDFFSGEIHCVPAHFDLTAFEQWIVNLPPEYSHIREPANGLLARLVKANALISDSEASEQSQSELKQLNQQIGNKFEKLINQLSQKQESTQEEEQHPNIFYDI